MNLLSFLIPAPHTRPLRYAIVIALTAVAFFMRLAMAPADGGIQYVTFFPVVAISAVVGGLWAGLVSAALGVTLATYFFWPPYGTFDFSFRYEAVVADSVFLIDALLVSSAIEAMHRFYRKFTDAESQLRLAASVFHNSVEGVIITDASGTIQAINPAFTRITGYTEAEAVGRTPSLLRSDRQEPEFYRAMWDALASTGCWQGELWNRRRNGETYLEWLTISRVVDGAGAPVRYVGVFHDVTELRRKEEQIRHLAFHDALTGLPNRTLIQDRLDHALQRARREGSRLAVAFIDLDHFKAINDTLGHAMGDLVLQEVAKRIKDRLRSMDTVARLGGDEFLLLMEDVYAREECNSVATDLIAVIAQPMELRGHTLQVGASIGMAFFPDDGADAQDLMKYADVAMYAAKAAGRNTHRFFRQDMLDAPVPEVPRGRDPHQAGEKSGEALAAAAHADRV
jgi:diguanylate cyclase (GGDEF)-like protein/PAS domain S-box-containing protein